MTTWELQAFDAALAHIDAHTKWGAGERISRQNAIQAVVEEKAREEIESCQRPFIDWVTDNFDGIDHALLISAIVWRSDRAGEKADKLESDYKQWRIANLELDEEREIMAQLKAKGVIE